MADLEAVDSKSATVAAMAPGSKETIANLIDGQAPTLADACRLIYAAADTGKTLPLPPAVVKIVAELEDEQKEQKEEEEVNFDDEDSGDDEGSGDEEESGDDEDTEEPQVFGAGLMRTGTKSLQLALERLLGGRCYHMTRVFEQPHHIPLWRRALHGQLSRRQWRRLLAGYRAAVDMPPCVFYRELHRRFPQAKFVLTLREAGEWYRSVRRTVVAANDEMKSPLGRLLFGLTPLADHAAMVDELCRRALGDDLRWDDAALMERRFAAHTAAVMAAVPADRLLLFDPRDGWEPLCRFLGVPTPQHEPYPHVNRGQDFLVNWRSFRRRQFALAGRRLAAWCLAGLGVSLLVLSAHNPLLAWLMT